MRHFRGLVALGDPRAEYRYERGIGYLTEELGPERSEYLPQGVAIAQRRQVGGHLQPLGPLADASGQDFLFVAPPPVKVALGNPRARSDLERPGRCVGASLEP